MNNNVIIAENLSYTYGDLKAVDSINFTVGKGEIIGFLGPNGAGKSTTIKMLTGQIIPGEGKASLLGMDITAKNTTAIRESIGVCFEHNNLYEQMTAKENLVFFAQLFGIKNFNPEILLRRVGLGDRMNESVSGYSKGMKQRLMIARSLVNEPKIWFLDEPTDGLDPVSSKAIRELILEEKKRGATIFLTTHDMAEADKLSDRVAFINQGKIAALDTPHNLKQQYGYRSVEAEVLNAQGKLEKRSLPLDAETTGEGLKDLFDKEQVVTLHSKEATLEDIFIKITGRGLAA